MKYIITENQLERLKEDNIYLPMLRRRMQDLPKYIKSSYQWLNPKSFDNFNKFIERVIFSTTRDFVDDFGANDYDIRLEIRKNLQPFIWEIIKSDYLDEIKKYYDKEMSK